MSVGDTDLPEEGQIDPHGEADFLIGSTTVDGTTDIEVWCHNLTIVSETVVSFDLVLVNRSNEAIHPPVFFYIAETNPQTARVLAPDLQGFGRSAVFELTHRLGDDNQLDPDEESMPVRIRFELIDMTSFAFGFWITVGEAPVGTGCSTPYPTTLDPLSSAELAVLRAEFAAQNPVICSGLNGFGFTADPCRGDRDIPDDADVDSLVAVAKAALVENAKFTGVVDASALVASWQNFHSGEFRVYFEEQLHEGLEVYGTRIEVIMDAAGVRSIAGHHFPEICVPKRPFYSAIQAQESIIGLRIPWYDFGGNLRIHVVSEFDLQGQPDKVVVPYASYGSIELRVAWRIPIGQHGSTMWYVFVDTMDKELVWIEQLFYT
jgi:hypothetical protein